MCAVYLVLIAVAAVGAALFMDNLTGQKADLHSMLEALRVRESWIVSFLYIGTFGSFIGFSFASVRCCRSLPRRWRHPAQAALHAAHDRVPGAAARLDARPLGGRLADRIGGGRITLWTFAAMVLAAAVLVAAAPRTTPPPAPRPGPP